MPQASLSFAISSLCRGYMSGLCSIWVAYGEKSQSKVLYLVMANHLGS